MTRWASLLLLIAGSAGFAFAGTNPAPEIDASAGAAAMTLLSGGLLVLRARRRKI